MELLNGGSRFMKLSSEPYKVQLSSDGFVGGCESIQELY